MDKRRVRRVYERGTATVELPFLVSCALHLLDRRFWILGIRYPLCGTRFDVVARLPGNVENLILVEAKFRSDGRPVRPYEVKRFAKEASKVRAELSACIIQAFFMTNTRFSRDSILLCRKEGIRMFPRVPLLFASASGKVGNAKRAEREKSACEKRPFSSNVSIRAGP